MIKFNKFKQGFTLVELLIVIVILGVLMAIAMPQYNEYVRKARRSDAKSSLLAAAQAMERFYTENTTYNAAVLGNAATDIAKAVSSDGYYTIAFDSAPTSATVCGTLVTTSATAGAYRLCATPTGAQSGDSCSIISLDQTGKKMPATGCW
ncbi:MAG: type IV pilin protein [Rhodocyclaceae bacterium]|nr:type IV pilin protein [Rhodocyclaceae bacterium]